MSWWRGFACLFLVAAGQVPLHAGEVLASAHTNAMLRLGFSTSVFSGVNENDAKAAMKVWAQAILKEHSLSVPADPQVLTADAIATAMQNKLIDAVTLSAAEYRVIGAEFMSTNAILGATGGRVTEEYLLLVHRDSIIGRIEDLRGRSLIFFQNPRASLAPVWFETLLLQSGLGPTLRFCGRVIQGGKLSQVVLPVFFHQADACVVTRRGFQTMIELNPQVGRQLEILLSSPAMVPFAFLFRSDYSDPVRDQIMAEIKDVHSTVAGQQALALFQCESLEVHPISVLDSALELLATHARLSEAANHAAEPTHTSIPLANGETDRP
jgi:phosphonate transport system substrate-binding protein